MDYATKIKILGILDDCGKPLPLKLIQKHFEFNIRNHLRLLQHKKKVLLMKERNQMRGIFWVKEEWVKDGKLLQQYKFDGFDELYNESDVSYV